MAENENKTPPQALAELSGRRTTTISEGRPFNVAERRQTTNISERNFTTIDEANRAWLTPDERKQVHDSLDNEVGDIEDNNEDRKRPSDENGKIFEEGDIIDWMFRNIIVKSMDWAGNKVTNAAAFLVGGATNAVLEYGSKHGGKLLKDTYDWVHPFKGGVGKFPEDSTTKLYKDVADLREKDIQDNQFTNEENVKTLKTSMDLIADNRIDDFANMMNGKISPETMQMLRNMPEEQRQSVFNKETNETTAASMALVISNINEFAGNVAYSRIMEEKINDKDKPKRKAAELYAQYQEEAKLDALTYLEIAAQDGRPAMNALTELIDLSRKSVKHTDEQISSRKYNELDRKPDPNNALREIESKTAVTKDSPYRGQTHLNDFATEVFKISKTQQELLDPINQAESNNNARQQQNNERRQRVLAARNNIQKTHQNDNNIPLTHNKTQGGRS